MKRLFFFAAFVLAIGSYGGHISPAHAQTLTSSDTASLQQQLDVAKATLANLETQAGVTPTGDAGSASTATVVTPVVATPVAVAQPVTAAAPELTAADVATFQNTLSELTATLTQLNASLAASASISPAQQSSVEVTLNGMKGTLVAMANAITASNGVVATPVTKVSASAPATPSAAVAKQRLGAASPCLQLGSPGRPSNAFMPEKLLACPERRNRQSDWLSIRLVRQASS